ncbi:MAG: DUF4394 domain-containing protein [Deltaproteobacteria bacterium]|nr:DUF4394 domain-containing protein [Deltaproteobacteria bacterium]MDQ3300410.1 DUF4394 domain-containing protein [Myxococcota bacterium]
MKTRFRDCIISLGLLAAAGCGDNGEPAGPDASPSDAPPVEPRVGDTVILTSGGRLVSFDRAAPTVATSAVTVTGLGSETGGSETIVAFDRRPADGALYALTTAGVLYTIAPDTGVATRKSALTADPMDTTSPFTALAGDTFGADFNPVVDRLRVTTSTGQNLRINVDTGVTITDGAINGAATGYGNVAYTNAFASACRTTLHAIDTATDQLLLQNPPNDGTAVAGGSLGLDATAIGGFDIETTATANTALAILVVGGSSGLYRIDLETGAATSVGSLPLAAGETALALASTVPATSVAIPQPTGELFGLTTGTKLVSFNRTAPGKLCTSAAITGIGAGDSPVGIDFRPSTGVLHVLTNNAGAGKLYTVDPASGIASSPVTLSVALAGTDFGVDFNPTGPVALRIVSDTGQNLRVTDIATGATTTDTPLNGAATQATGAAYTNSAPGAVTTALYVLDATANRLLLQNPPNLGTLVDVGALGADIDSVNGFDIDGRDNVALLAANLATSTGTTLHTVNLTTGAASAPLGVIGGGERLRGLARPTP